MRDYSGKADELWELREDRRAKERESVATSSVGVCRLIEGDDPWLEGADDATPVVVVVDLNAVPGLRDIASVVTLIGATGVCLLF